VRHSAELVTSLLSSPSKKWSPVSTAATLWQIAAHGTLKIQTKLLLYARHGDGNDGHSYL
jgi:hypothetical protein